MRITREYLKFDMKKEGTIARLTDKGYGFITAPEMEKDLFFHMNELDGVEFDSLKEGDKVSFEVAEGPKGLNAVGVSKVEEMDQAA